MQTVARYGAMLGWPMTQNKPNNPVATAIAFGLLTGLGFAVVGQRVWDEMEVSQGLTIAVVAVGFLLGAGVTWIARGKRSAS